MTKTYKHIFFDLDHTLWDFEQSAYHTFQMMYDKYGLKEKGIPTLAEFLKTYTHHNSRLWESYRNGTLKKEVLRSLRFEHTLGSFGISEPGLAMQLGDDYVYYSPRTVYLMPGARETIEKLAGIYPLHLITNGFEEVQHVKLHASGLKSFFRSMTTSEEAGVKKPDKAIFDFALQKAGAVASESLMIGDDLEVDVLGAKSAGLDQVYFNPEGRQHSESITHDIRSLTALLRIL